MHSAIFILLVILGSCLIYIIELGYFWVFFRILEIPKTKKIFISPAILVGSIVLLMIIGHFIHDVFFQIFYDIGTGILAVEINMILFIIIYLIVNKCKKLNKWISLSIILVPSIALSIYGFICPHIIHVDRKTLYFHNFNNTVTIAHLSDVHLGPQLATKFSKKIVNKLKELNPDIVVITGDFADGTIKFKSEWIEPFNELNMSILYVTGNHEKYHSKDEVLEEVFKSNIKYIGNTTYDTNGIRFIGVDYEYTLDERLDELYENGLLEYSTTVPNVLLAHIPSIKPYKLKRWNIFLFLCGHTHFGQMFPGHIFGALMYPLFNGLYSNDDNHVYVSQGVGFTTFPMRTFTKSVIAMITIKGKY